MEFDDDSFSRNDYIQRRLKLVRGRSSPHPSTQKLNLESLVTDCVAESVVNSALDRDTDSNAARVRRELCLQMKNSGARCVNFDDPFADTEKYSAEHMRGTHSPTLMATSASAFASSSISRNALGKVLKNRFTEDPDQQGCVTAMQRSIPQQEALLESMAMSKRQLEHHLRGLSEKAHQLSQSNIGKAGGNASFGGGNAGGAMAALGASKLVRGLKRKLTGGGRAPGSLPPVSSLKKRSLTEELPTGSNTSSPARRGTNQSSPTRGMNSSSTAFPTFQPLDLGMSVALANSVAPSEMASPKGHGNASRTSAISASSATLGATAGGRSATSLASTKRTSFAEHGDATATKKRSTSVKGGVAKGKRTASVLKKK